MPSKVSFLRLQYSFVSFIKSAIHVNIVGSKHQKEFLKDLKSVYKSVNKETAEDKLDDLELKWGE